MKAVFKKYKLYYTMCDDKVSSKGLRIMSNILTTEHLTKCYKDEKVLKDINLHVSKNEVYCLLGPNGAGKTTIMKILTGMLSKTNGAVYFENHIWNRKDLKNIGSLIENAPIYGNLTARENMEVVTLLRGADPKQINTILKTVGLDNTKRKLAKQFSLGMKERLGIGLALIGNPKLIILDEPTNGLDPLGIQELRNLISKLKDKNITIIISSHMLSEVEHLADTIGILGNGKILLEQKYDHKTNLEEIFNNILRKNGVLND